MSTRTHCYLACLLGVVALGASITANAGTDAKADDVDISTYSVTPEVDLMSDVLNRGVSDSFNDPGVRLGVTVAHQSGLVAVAQINNVSKQEFNNGDGTDITLAGGWRFGNPDRWHFGIGLATEIFPGAQFQAPQAINLAQLAPADITNTNFNTAYAVLEIGYGDLQGRILNVISKNYRGANTGGVCGAMLEFMADPTRGLECYARGPHNSRGTSLFDLDYKYALRGDTTLNLHTGYQNVVNFPEADTFDYSVGVTHTRWGVQWSLSWAGAHVRTQSLYLVQQGNQVKSIDKPVLLATAVYDF